MYAFKKIENKGWKIASKGARLKPEEIIKVAKGSEVIYSPEAPTYSVHSLPRFTHRRINKT